MSRRRNNQIPLRTISTKKMNGRLASEASTVRIQTTVKAAVEHITTDDYVLGFFHSLLANGINARDTFKKRSESVQLVKSVNNELYEYVSRNQGRVRDLDIFDRGKKEDTGMTALMWACLFNWEHVVRVIIDLGADAKLKLNQGRNILMIAAWRGDPNLVSFLCETFPSLLPENDVNKDTALATAVFHNRINIITTLIKADEGIRTLDYDTSLMKSIELQRTEAGLQLVPKVKDVNMGPRRTPYLFKAANKGCIEIAEALIKKGAKVDKISRSGMTALTEAAQQGHVETVKLLLKYEADPNLASDDESKNTALHYAARYNRCDVIKALKQYGADILAEDKDHSTPFYTAIKFQAVDAQKLLSTGKCERRMLEEAVRSGCLESAEDLLTNCEYSQDTLDAGLVQACYNGFGKIAKLLIEKFQANPNTKDGDNLSCAIAATRKGHLEVAKVLFDNKADYLSADKNNCTAIHYLMACKPSEELIKEVRNAYGMSAFTKKDSEGRSAIYYANHEETIVSLLDLKTKHKKWKTKTEYDQGPDEDENNIHLTQETFSEAVMKFPNLKDAILEEFIQPIGYGPNDPELEVEVDFKVFLQDRNFMEGSRPRNDVIAKLLANQSEALSHPVTKLFLSKKYSGFPQCFSAFQATIYLILAFVFTFIAINSIKDGAEKENLLNTISFIAVIVPVVLGSILEFLNLDEQGCRYFTKPRNWFRLLLYTITIVCALSSTLLKNTFKSSLPTQLCDSIRASQSFVILGLFFNFLLVLRRNPTYGIYISMFCNVLQNVAALIIPIGFLVVAFAAAFFVVYQRENFYSSLVTTGFKIVSMMMGSIDPDEVYETLGSNVPLFVAQCLLFIVFIIFMPIIIVNLLIGITISDVAAEIPLAKWTHLLYMTEHIVHSENIAKALCLDRFLFKEESIKLSISSYSTREGIMARIAHYLTPRSTPQFKHELMEELQIIVKDLYVKSTEN